MKLALVTQRVDPHPDYAERRDALDQRWAPLLDAAGFLACSISNAADTNVAAIFDRLAPDLLVLSGGNSIARVEATAPNAAPERDALEAKLIDLAVANGVPVVGVCRGMQMLNLHFGGHLSRVSGHVATRHELRGEGPMQVNSYHEFGIAPDDLAPVFEATAWAPDGTVEAIRHRSQRVAGVMWHPEREEPFDSWDLAWLGEV